MTQYNNYDLPLGDFKDPALAFDEAINRGLLSDDETLDNYAGHYMYMHTINNVDQFKNINTRKYIS